MAVLLLGCVRTKQDQRKKSIRFIWVVLVCIVYLLSNAFAYAMIYRDYFTARISSDFGMLFHFVECISYISYYILLVLVVFYVSDLVRENAAIPAWLPITVIPAAALGIVSWCVSSFTHLMGKLDSTGYRPGPLYWLGQITGYYILTFLIFLIVHYRKTLGRGRVAIFSFFVAIPLAAIILRQYFPAIDFLSLALALSVIFVRNLLDIERARTVNQQEARLREGRVRLMLSQIRPHFLYNTLNTIYVLCEQEPAAAQRAIEELSEFLRANIGSLESDRPVPFDTEMKLVRHYLYLEQMRYQEELQVEIFLKAQNFSLPPLTIQPLVENAVKHGLAKAPGGGTVRKSSARPPRFQAQSAVCAARGGIPSGRRQSAVRGGWREASHRPAERPRAPSRDVRREPRDPERARKGNRRPRAFAEIIKGQSFFLQNAFVSGHRVTRNDQKQVNRNFT